MVYLRKLKSTFSNGATFNAIISVVTNVTKSLRRAELIWRNRRWTWGYFFGQDNYLFRLRQCRSVLLILYLFYQRVVVVVDVEGKATERGGVPRENDDHPKIKTFRWDLHQQMPRVRPEIFIYRRCFTGNCSTCPTTDHKCKANFQIQPTSTLLMCLNQSVALQLHLLIFVSYLLIFIHI